MKKEKQLKPSRIEGMTPERYWLYRSQKHDILRDRVAKYAKIIENDGIPSDLNEEVAVTRVKFKAVRAGQTIKEYFIEETRLINLFLSVESEVTLRNIEQRKKGTIRRAQRRQEIEKKKEMQWASKEELLAASKERERLRNQVRNERRRAARVLNPKTKKENNKINKVKQIIQKQKIEKHKKENIKLEPIVKKKSKTKQLPASYFSNYPMASSVRKDYIPIEKLAENEGTTVLDIIQLSLCVKEAPRPVFVPVFGSCYTREDAVVISRMLKERSYLDDADTG